ncbi:MAG: PspC domain-containing protein [Rikenellaceae bacterium]|jgi:phage shock protein PspC (stress-responsive transcriptional regulator)|nr:PspC domain-containing protein [Rikenellaceae bacterium]
MKEIVNVSIAGISFRLDDEAYARLDDYLDQLRKRYASTPDGGEIIGDIETRIAEIVLSQQESTVVVGLELISQALEQLGRPEDIAEGIPADTDDPSASEAEKIPRRLYRDPDNAKIGGVCAGLAAYFGTDPVMVRLAMFSPLVIQVVTAPFFHGWGFHSLLGTLTGAFFMLYFILLIAIPKAKTPRQKLEMRGEKITAGKIERTFREEFSAIENNVRNWSKNPERGYRNASIFSEIVTVLGRVVLFFIKFIAAIIGISLMLSVIGIIVGAVFTLIRPDSFPVMFLDGPLPVTLGVLVAVAVVIPLLLLAYMLFHTVYDFRNSKGFVSTLGVIWILVVVFGTVILIKDFDQIRTSWKDGISDYHEKPRPNVEETADFPFAGKVLYIAPADSAAWAVSTRFYSVKFHPLTGSDYSAPTLRIKKSYEGIDKDIERNRVKGLAVPYELRGDTLFVSPYEKLDEGIHHTRIDFSLYLPDSLEYKVLQGLSYDEYITE